MAPSPFSRSHPYDRWLMPAFLVVAWISIFLGFSDSVCARFAGKADFPAPPMLQLHVFVATGWMLGLVLQVALIRIGRPHLHRAVGLAMLANTRTTPGSSSNPSRS